VLNHWQVTRATMRWLAVAAWGLGAVKMRTMRCSWRGRVCCFVLLTALGVALVGIAAGQVG